MNKNKIILIIVTIILLPFVIFGSCFVGFMGTATISQNLGLGGTDGWDSIGYGFIGGIIAILIALFFYIKFIIKKFKNNGTTNSN